MLNGKKVSNRKENFECKFFCFQRNFVGIAADVFDDVAPFVFKEAVNSTSGRVQSTSFWGNRTLFVYPCLNIG